MSSDVEDTKFTENAKESYEIFEDANHIFMQFNSNKQNSIRYFPNLKYERFIC